MRVSSIGLAVVITTLSMLIIKRGWVLTDTNVLGYAEIVFGAVGIIIAVAVLFGRNK